MSNIRTTTITKIDVIEGDVSADIDALNDIVLENVDSKLSEKTYNSRNEDSFCPPNEIVDEIISQMIADFKTATGHDIRCTQYWGHVHEHNMSTNTHNHGECFASSVLYLSVPEGSGDLVFIPKINQYNNAMYRTYFPPAKGRYYMFPSFIDHYVTRNQSKEKRVSISFNFRKV